MCCHNVFFSSLSLSFRCTLLSPRRGYRLFLKFCMGFLTKLSETCSTSNSCFANYFIFEWELNISSWIRTSTLHGMGLGEMLIGWLVHFTKLFPYTGHPHLYWVTTSIIGSDIQIYSQNLLWIVCFTMIENNKFWNILIAQVKKNTFPPGPLKSSTKHL
jgi:hypothetical protein